MPDHAAKAREGFNRYVMDTYGREVRWTNSGRPTLPHLYATDRRADLDSEWCAWQAALLAAERDALESMHKDAINHARRFADVCMECGEHEAAARLREYADVRESPQHYGIAADIRALLPEEVK